MTFLRRVAGVKRLLSDDSGAEIVEYGLVIGLIAIAGATALSSAGVSNAGAWDRIAGFVASVPGG